MGVYDGLPRETLLAQLQAMQMALLQLTAGEQIASVSYSQGEGARSVTYRATDLSALRAEILSLQAALDIGGGRRQIGFRYRR